MAYVGPLQKVSPGQLLKLSAAVNAARDAMNDACRDVKVEGPSYNRLRSEFEAAVRNYREALGY